MRIGDKPTKFDSINKRKQAHEKPSQTLAGVTVFLWFACNVIITNYIKFRQGFNYSSSEGSQATFTSPRVVRLVYRDHQEEYTSSTQLAFHPDPAAMSISDRFHDG